LYFDSCWKSKENILGGPVFSQKKEPNKVLSPAKLSLIKNPIRFSQRKARHPLKNLICHKPSSILQSGNTKD